MALFGSQEWLDSYCENLNNSQAYADAAKTWEGDFVFVAEADATCDQDIYLWLDLWHGQARAGEIISSLDDKPDAEFVYSGPYVNYKLLAAKKIDPIQGLMTGKFKLKGDMAKVMRAVKAAQELVNTIIATETEFL